MAASSSTLRLLALALSAATARAACKATTIDLKMQLGNAAHNAYSEEIAAELGKLGITVWPTFRETREELNADMVAGNYDMVFSETWGPPYDPHSYVSSWTTPDEAHYSALPTAGIDTTQFATDVDAVLAEMDETERQKKWTAILTSVHDEVLHLPLWYKRIPALVNNARISGYAPGAQQFDYPIHKASVVGGGSTTVKVAPGAQAGLFTSVGRLDPHSYRPNEFFANNWVYEGLVKYDGGTLQPALATAWTSEVSADGVGETFRFTLRTGVKFHDGADFDCSVVKLNFDHVWAGDLTSPDWHGWYRLPGALKDWSCDGETFVLNTNAPYYPLLQELSYIRPMVMLSPNAFVGGAASDPYTQNSCPTGWGTVAATADHAEVTCAGITAIAGTGPFMFESRTANADNADHDDLVVFAANADYWDAANTGNIEKVHIVRYDDAAAVKAAMLDGSLDAVLGAEVLAPSDEEELGAQTGFDLTYGPPQMTTMLIMNIADKEVRQAIVHGVDRAAIIASELNDAYEPADRLFPSTMPYCDVPLTPFEYDLAKAEEINCPGGGAAVTTTTTTTTTTTKKKTKKEDMNGFKYGILFMVLFVIALLSGLAFIVMKEKEGEPIFMDITTKTPLTPTSKVENA